MKVRDYVRKYGLVGRTSRERRLFEENDDEEVVGFVIVKTEFSESLKSANVQHNVVTHAEVFRTKRGKLIGFINGWLMPVKETIKFIDSASVEKDNRSVVLERARLIESI